MTALPVDLAELLEGLIDDVPASLPRRPGRRSATQRGAGQPTLESALADESGSQVIPIDRQARREADQWVWRVAQVAVEIVSGNRSSSQLLRCVSSDVYADLRRRARLVALAGAHQGGPGQHPAIRPQVASVHCTWPRPGVIEAAVRVRYGRRSRAVAARFEHRDDARGDHAWVCTAFDFS
ncbi:Rv3235 family protein [Nocardioides acrostichi]|uniref:Uncharacterized protein n=1 Tax=Nocardioides acrostichi TaxID=2784339 RepID=A0A930UXE0_9ACTN|nr:Rv3235 family protein [Nocardioides acrostichi]MBF4161876.1 hypothetical protein [Nocardioides acrostichi]